MSFKRSSSYEPVPAIPEPPPKRGRRTTDPIVLAHCRHRATPRLWPARIASRKEADEARREAAVGAGDGKCYVVFLSENAHHYFDWVSAKDIHDFSAITVKHREERDARAAEAWAQQLLYLKSKITALEGAAGDVQGFLDGTSHECPVFERIPLNAGAAARSNGINGDGGGSSSSGGSGKVHVFNESAFSFDPRLLECPWRCPDCLAFTATCGCPKGFKAFLEKRGIVDGHPGPYAANTSFLCRSNECYCRIRPGNLVLLAEWGTRAQATASMPADRRVRLQVQRKAAIAEAAAARGAPAAATPSEAAAAAATEADAASSPALEATAAAAAAELATAANGVPHSRPSPSPLLAQLSEPLPPGRRAAPPPPPPPPPVPLADLPPKQRARDLMSSDVQKSWEMDRSVLEAFTTTEAKQESHPLVSLLRRAPVKRTSFATLEAARRVRLLNQLTGLAVEAMHLNDARAGNGGGSSGGNGAAVVQEQDAAAAQAVLHGTEAELSLLLQAELGEADSGAGNNGTNPTLQAWGMVRSALVRAFSIHRTLVLFDPTCKMHAVDDYRLDQAARIDIAAAAADALACDAAVRSRVVVKRQIDPNALEKVRRLRVVEMAHSPAYVARLKALVERAGNAIDTLSDDEASLRKLQRTQALKKAAAAASAAAAAAAAAATGGASSSGGGCGAGGEVPAATGKGETIGSKLSYLAAETAVAAVVQAVDAVMSGAAHNAFVAVRPPGHHAGCNGHALGAISNGFCLINNVGAGALYARNCAGANRVAVVDFDVHHGNGTQDVLCNVYRPDFFFISMHSYEGPHSCIFPGTGEGGGPHSNVLNLPLGRRATAAGVKKAAAAAAEALRRFRPDLVLLSAGFDAHKNDPTMLGDLSASELADMTCQLLAAAEETCGGRVVSVLEGGYCAEFQGLDTCLLSQAELQLSVVGGSAGGEGLGDCLEEHMRALVSAVPLRPQAAPPAAAAPEGGAHEVIIVEDD